MMNKLCNFNFVILGILVIVLAGCSKQQELLFPDLSDEHSLKFGQDLTDIVNGLSCDPTLMEISEICKLETDAPFYTFIHFDESNKVSLVKYVSIAPDNTDFFNEALSFFDLETSDGERYKGSHTEFNKGDLIFQFYETVKIGNLEDVMYENWEHLNKELSVYVFEENISDKDSLYSFSIETVDESESRPGLLGLSLGEYLPGRTYYSFKCFTANIANITSCIRQDSYSDDAESYFSKVLLDKNEVYFLSVEMPSITEQELVKYMGDFGEIKEFQQSRLSDASAISIYYKVFDSGDVLTLSNTYFRFTVELIAGDTLTARRRLEELETPVNVSTAKFDK